MKDKISKLIDELKSLIVHDTYVLTQDNSSELSWKIDAPKQTILDTYKNKRVS